MVVYFTALLSMGTSMVINADGKPFSEIMADEKKVIARVPDELHRAAKIKAAITGRPVSEVIREALEKWVKDSPPEEKD